MKPWSQSHQRPWNLFNELRSKVLFAILLLIVSSKHTKSRNLVQTLPGFDGDLPFTLETGYIGVGESDAVQLIYYFVESQRDPQSDPIMLMHLGGPGCSILFTLISKSGPLYINSAKSTSEKQVLELNSHSWTKVANILYLDHNAGCGFSYAQTPEAYTTNDILSATQTHQFIRKWLVEHPKFLNNPLYLASSSYSGIVVPVIADEIYKGNEVGQEPKINIKGYVLGNPLTDKHTDSNAKFPLAHRMALLSDAIYKSLQKKCNEEYLNVDPNNTQCMHDLQVANKCLERVETEQILDPQCDSSNTLKSNLFKRGLRYFDKSTRDILSLHSGPCESTQEKSRIFTNWADNRDVRKALHISEELDGIGWVPCNESMTFRFGKEETTYKHNVNSSVVYHKHLADKNCRALIYSGDHDLAVPYLGTMKWIESLNLLKTSYWRPWFVDEQVAGYTMTYSNHQSYNLTFTTIKGGSHTPGEYKPEVYLSMLRRWLANDAL